MGRRQIAVDGGMIHHNREVGMDSQEKAQPRRPNTAILWVLIVLVIGGAIGFFVWNNHQADVRARDGYDKICEIVSDC